MEYLLYPSECVICLHDVDKTSNYPDRNQTLISYLEHSILKLLNLDSSALSMTNSINYEQEDKEASQLFCTKCFERNVEIHNLFAQIEALGRSLEGLKSSIGDQVRESEQTLKERETGRHVRMHDNSDSSSELKYHLRNEIFRGLGPFFLNDVENYVELPFVADDIFEDEWDPAEVENSNNEITHQECTTEDMGNNSKQQSVVESSSSTKATKEKYDVKELSISVQRLPRSIIPNKKININSLPPSLRLRRSVAFKRAYKERSTSFKTKLARSSTEDAVRGKKRKRTWTRRFCCNPFNTHVNPKRITANKNSGYVRPHQVMMYGSLYPTIKYRASICVPCIFKLRRLPIQPPENMIEQQPNPSTESSTTATIPEIKVEVIEDITPVTSDVDSEGSPGSDPDYTDEM